MEFKEFKSIFQRHVEGVLEGESRLFVTAVDKDVLWNTYLDSFPPGTNEVFRERRAFDCSCCRSFMRAWGNVVVIDGNYDIVTAWDFETGSNTYQPVVDALAAYVKSEPVKDAFITKEGAFGTDYNHEQLESGAVHTWEHFRVELPKQFVTRSSKSELSLMGEARETKEVFERSLAEISRDAVSEVLDLIAEKSLYKGDEWQGALTQFLALSDEYHSLPDGQRNNYCWKQAAQVSGAVGRIRNHSIGTLLQDLTAGVDMAEAVRKFEAIVAPQNYKRPKAIFTRKMVERAEATVTELGLLDSLGRRHAHLEDITINNVLWANRDAARQMEGAGVFEALRQDVAVNPKRFERAQGMGIDQFIEEILPTAMNLEVLLENRHERSLVSLIAPEVRDNPTLFKWDNAFSWAYNGNVADSMKQRVKAAGGNVTGVLRFSLQWNEEHDNRNDFDAHCNEPDGNHIWFHNKGRRHSSSGMLDVDIIHPNPAQVAVENITWSARRRMQEGMYEFYVHNYSHRGGRSGFSAEIEYDGQIYEYEYCKELAQDEKVRVARLKFNGRDGIEILESLPTTTSTKKIWGLQTNQFHPVSVCTFSPNYWDGQRGVGHQHCFFMLAGCENDQQPNGFFNEYLRESFMEYKRVFAALGSKMKVARSDSQLSGLGFSSTRRNSLVCKVDGQRVVKIVF